MTSRCIRVCSLCGLQLALKIKVELVGVPRVRHVAVVLGGQPKSQYLNPNATSSSQSPSPAPSNGSEHDDLALKCSYASTSSVLDGGVVVLSAPSDLNELLKRRLAHADDDDQRASTTAASLTSGALAFMNSFAMGGRPQGADATGSGPLGWANQMAAAHAAVALRGATVYATVDFETREFLAARRGQGPTARWAKASFSPWAPATRQWVLASPLWAPTSDAPYTSASDPKAGQGDGPQSGLGFKSSGAVGSGASWWPQAAPPEWQVVDLDGVLGSRACFAQPLVDAYHAQDHSRREEVAVSSNASRGATEKNIRSRG